MQSGLARDDSPAWAGQAGNPVHFPPFGLPVFRLGQTAGVVYRVFEADAWQDASRRAARWAQQVRQMG